MRISGLSILSTLALQASSTTIHRRAALEKCAVSTTWASLGCYIDNVSGRALPNGVQVVGGSAAMTNEACQTACSTAGYTIAGTEYAGECWCGNSVVNGGGPAPDGSVGCNMACNGNNTEICGGSNRLSVYEYATTAATAAGKRGLAYNNNNPGANAEYANLFKGYSQVSWGYDWGYPSWGLDASFEFVPMLWGGPSGADTEWTAAVKTAGTKSILAFNEPDLTYSASSNMLPAVAATSYQTYIQPFVSLVKVGLPSVLWNNWNSWSSGGSYNSRVWTQYFMGNCTNCHFDYAAIHYYEQCAPGSDAALGVSYFQSNVTDAWDTLKLPVWITEFQCYGTDAEQTAFLKAVMPWMDAQAYVEKYAYFGVFPDYLVNTAGTALSDMGLAYATAT